MNIAEHNSDRLVIVLNAYTERRLIVAATALSMGVAVSGMYLQSPTLAVIGGTTTMICYLFFLFGLETMRAEFDRRSGEVHLTRTIRVSPRESRIPIARILPSPSQHDRVEAVRRNLREAGAGAITALTPTTQVPKSAARTILAWAGDS